MNCIRVTLAVVLGGIALDCTHLIIQGMNPINTVAPQIYHWTPENSQQLYGVASSLPMVTAILSLLYPCSWLLKQVGRLNSMRIGFLGIIIGSSLTLIRHTAGILIGRAISGIAMSITIFNAVPYVSAFALPDRKYFYGSVAIVIGRAGPFFHAFTFLAIDSTQVDQNRNWIWALMFPGIIAFLGLVISLLNPYESPDGLWMSGQNEDQFAIYYTDVLQEKTSRELHVLLTKRFEQGIDFSVREYLCRPVLRHKFWVANLMQLSRHFIGNSVHIVFLFFVLSRYQEQKTAFTFNLISLASDIWILSLASVMFYFIKRVKLLWILGNLAMLAFCLSLGILILLNQTSPIKWLILFQRQVFGITIEQILFNYIPQVLPPVGLGLNFALFYIVGFVASQTFVPMLEEGEQVPYLVYSGIALVITPLFILWMREADEYGQLVVEQQEGDSGSQQIVI